MMRGLGLGLGFFALLPPTLGSSCGICSPTGILCFPIPPLIPPEHR